MALLSNVKTLLILLKDIVCLLCKEAAERIRQAEAKSVAADIILITGGGRGIGKQIALQFALHKPAHIIIWGRNEQHLEETSKAVHRLDVNCSYMLCDMADREQIYACAQELKAKFGEVSILVNNAGVVIGSNILDAHPEDLDYTFRVNTLAHLWTLKAFLPDMLKNNRGHIVSVSSVLGLFGVKGAGDYVSSKFASTGLAEAVRHEMAVMEKDVRVTSIHPYQLGNDMFAGMSARVSFLLPPVSERYVAERIVDAVLHNREQVLLPRLMYLLHFFNSLMPLTVATVVNKALGVEMAMDRVHRKSFTSVVPITPNASLNCGLSTPPTPSKSESTPLKSATPRSSTPSKSGASKPSTPSKS